MKQSSSRVTVVMPVYNAELYLAEALKSILIQDTGNFPILIVNDGSTDGSGKILQKFAGEHDNILVFERENRGIPESVNELFSMVETEYVTRMDADDVSLPGRFLRQIEFLDAHTQIAAVGSGTIYIDPSGRPIHVQLFPLDHDAIEYGNLRGRTGFAQSSVMMRTSIVKELGGYDPFYKSAQDLDLWLRMGEHARLANLPDVLLKYRLTYTGISGSGVVAQSQRAEHACRSAWARRNIPDMPLPDDHWRPTGTSASHHDFALKWGWLAWNAGNLSTARSYFRRALRFSPLSPKAWKALGISLLRGPPSDAS